uniref:Rab-GAP TBC domain-containing protein n=1 Tax=Anopheles coluzzii TaxID=1518534 RepID=A0A6E8VG42_ANOCL|nr:USP6 N-terminal-like protein isoform X1 [Anopheles coluzzii]XP_040218472.2 USP6 N-terminal-like protein isoform X1 [Anopheles coluzzii]XP_049461507.1 USP6 N-terminal-like protein isoform X1 [Anopheles coluzzii]XP_049461508.1 USP6 N-terminal-like protein isoform X1 [Anopheles coluzzii]
MTRYDRYSLSTDQQQQKQTLNPPSAAAAADRKLDTVAVAPGTTMTDEELLLLERANAERDEIFLRYDQGRKCDSIDAWEDPMFEVYTQADRYGFLHPVAPAQSKEAELLQHRIEMERVKKWVKMHKNWDAAATKENLRRRVMKGIPDRMRSAIWRKLLDLDRQIRENGGMYDRMLDCARRHSPDIRQIDFDVNRQFRNHVFYRERYSVKQQSLFRVLAAYSMYNTEVGYCQGMSTVAAVLLMYFDEEDTFWALDVLMTNQRYAMHGLYIVGFPKLMRFLAHHDRILTKCLPKVKKHLDKHEVHSVLYSLKWFFVIFIERIPFSLCLRVWDIYMMYGERVLTAMAYTILKVHKTKLLRMKDMDQVTDFLQTSLHKQFGYDDDYVIKALQSSMDELKKLKLLNLPPPSANELPTMPRGQTVEPSTKARIGHRNEQFSEREIALKETVLYRSESKNEEEEEQYNNGVQGAGDRAATAEDEDDERTEKDYDDITEDTVSQLHTVSDMDGGSITKHSLTGTSVTSTNDISLTSYDRTCDIFRLQASGQHPSSRDPPPAGTTSAVLLLDQLAAQLSDEELSSYGAAVELMLDDEEDDGAAEAGNPVQRTKERDTGDDVSLVPEESEERELDPMEQSATDPSPNGQTNPTIMLHSPEQQQPAVDEEDEDELTEKQLSF